MTVDEPRISAGEPVLAQRPARDNVYQFPSARERDHDQAAVPRDEDSVLQELEEALHNWF